MNIYNFWQNTPPRRGGDECQPVAKRRKLHKSSNFAKAAEAAYNLRKIAQVLSFRKEPRRSVGGDFYKSYSKDGKLLTGFTISEVIIVIAILTILAAVVITDFVFMQKRTTLDNGAQEFIGAVRSAQNKTLASESGSQYGVYLDASVSPNKYTLFKGTSYALPGRDVSSDQVYFLPDTIEFYAILFGGGNEIVFDRVTGLTQKSGNVSLRVKTDASQNKTVYISNFGVVSFNQAPTSLDTNRVKDSRHVTFDYSRLIVNTESIVLTFDGGAVVQQIPISLYSTSGPLDWEGSVLVGGVNQKIHIHTYNNISSSPSQFSVFRDRRYNNKSLNITISGDGSGSLAQYSADGLSTSYSSIYVSNFLLK